MPVSVVGVDLSKSVFQLSLADAKHRVIDRKRLSRAQCHRFLAQSTPARLVMEGCGTSNCWGRARVARICEARALLAEFGISASVGIRGIGKKLTMATEQAPILIQPTLLDLIQEIDDLEQRLKRVDHALAAYADANSDVQALLGIQGIGVTIATAFVARVPSIHMFKRGRSFSSWLGLTCREYSSGQTRRLSRITKQGDRYLRTMLVHGARAALMAARRRAANGKQLTRLETWAVNTQDRIGHNKATVALANKMACIMWAVWTRHETFNGDDALRFAA